MITNVKWKNHNILGNLELDFTKNGKACNTIVIAGENGTGKTTILDTLATFLSGNTIIPFDYIKYTVENEEIEIYYDETVEFPDAGRHKRHILGIDQDIYVKQCKEFDYELMLKDKQDLRSYGVAYSKAQSGFKTNQVKSTTTLQIDDDKHNIADDVDIADDFTIVKQLIVDISSQDNSELRDLVEKNNKITKDEYEKFKENSRIHRFKNAFNEFFKKAISFYGVDEFNSEEKKIVFKKNNKDIFIDALSTGEKQIVFRGSYLLRNQKILNGGTILIDEPELSMHPLWQEKILDYYRNLFKTDNKQNVQMIVATHSEYVIKNALKDKENVLVIELKNDNGEIKGQPVITPTVLPTITLAETNYNTFNIVSNDYHILLYGYLQILTNNTDSVRNCDEYIKNYIINNNKNQTIYLKYSSYRNTDYQTLSTYIRNEIDHPHPGDSNGYGEEDLRVSIELLIEIIKTLTIDHRHTD